MVYPVPEATKTLPHSSVHFLFATQETPVTQTLHLSQTTA